MTGHQPLIAMRLAGRIPGDWIEVYDTADGIAMPCVRTDDPVMSWTTPSNESGAITPTVQVKHSETPEALDMRFVVGLNVRASTYHSLDRAKRLHGALVLSNARRVITCYHAPRGGMSAMFDTANKKPFEMKSYG